jgi:hypothetical protein
MNQRVIQQTQIGWGSLVIVALTDAIVAGVSLQTTAPVWVLLVILGISAAAAFMCATLTVQVTRDGVDAWFTGGLFRRQYPFSAIEAAGAARRPIPLSFGYRTDFHGRVVYIVTGGDVLVLKLAGGGIFEAGCNDASALADAIRERLPSGSAPAVPRFP